MTTPIQSHSVRSTIHYHTQNLPKSSLQSAQFSLPISRRMRLLYIPYKILHLPRWHIFLIPDISFNSAGFRLTTPRGRAMAKIDPNDGPETDEEDEGGVTQPEPLLYVLQCKYSTLEWWIKRKWTCVRCSGAWIRSSWRVVHQSDTTEEVWTYILDASTHWHSSSRQTRRMAQM